eukprot:TRINITY_DN12200_c0_g1_i1.p1 TRINITY_DN12200_c0_g1~~TRINITY_DN12200_c0_g1_i1.p1  ORF type:complete len:117 (+),score=12.60 TRINITY_DN12200_c0_g1_i1:2-352(+)
MKIVALPHLHKALKPIIAEILKSKKTCELDPVRIQETDEKKKQAQLKKNMLYFTPYLKQTISSIYLIQDIFPMALRNILNQIKTVTSQRFKDVPDAVYFNLTAFVFLRFICPGKMR